ncbi:MAG: hypothetical protein QNJ30_12370 [Kiloniellales bacterium]|nr:hypothetical protein [Kiloniellales bacterium]
MDRDEVQQAESGGSAEPIEAAPDPAETAPAWPDDLPEELAKAAQKFAGPTEALRSYVELERRLGRAVVLPGEAADAAEWRQFHRRLGVPERPEDYPVSFPARLDASEESGVLAERRGRFLAAMQAAGATPGVVQAALDWFGGEVEGLDAAGTARRDRAETASEGELRRAWGPDYVRNLALARRAVQRFGAEEGGALAELTLADGSRLGSQAGFLRLLAAVGGALLEDQPLIGPGGPEDDGLARRIDALHGLPAERYKAEEVQSELRSLYRRLHGGAG